MKYLVMVMVILFSATCFGAEFEIIGNRPNLQRERTSELQIQGGFFSRTVPLCFRIEGELEITCKCRSGYTMDESSNKCVRNVIDEPDPEDGTTCVWPHVSVKDEAGAVVLDEERNEVCVCDEGLVEDEAGVCIPDEGDPNIVDVDPDLLLKAACEVTEGAEGWDEAIGNCICPDDTRWNVLNEDGGEVEALKGECISVSDDDPSGSGGCSMSGTTAIDPMALILLLSGISSLVLRKKK